MSEKGEVFERELFIAASPETVFGFLVDPALMAEWFGMSHTLEPRPGGIFRVECNDGNVACGVYTEVVAHRRVAFTWGWESSDQALSKLKPGASLVEVDLEPKEGGTLIHFRHGGLASSLMKIHSKRWSMYLGIFGRAAAKREKKQTPKTLAAAGRNEP